jgi:hypothetical protein
VSVDFCGSSPRLLTFAGTRHSREEPRVRAGTLKSIKGTASGFTKLAKLRATLLLAQGVHPLANGIASRRLIRSYAPPPETVFPQVITGGQTRDRSEDLTLFRRALYQLSYLTKVLAEFAARRVLRT